MRYQSTKLNAKKCHYTLDGINVQLAEEGSFFVPLHVILAESAARSRKDKPIAPPNGWRLGTRESGTWTYCKETKVDITDVDELFHEVWDSTIPAEVNAELLSIALDVALRPFELRKAMSERDVSLADGVPFNFAETPTLSIYVFMCPEVTDEHLLAFEAKAYAEASKLTGACVWEVISENHSLGARVTIRR